MAEGQNEKIKLEFVDMLWIIGLDAQDRYEQSEYAARHGLVFSTERQ